MSYQQPNTVCYIALLVEGPDKATLRVGDVYFSINLSEKTRVILDRLISAATMLKDAKEEYQECAEHVSACNNEFSRQLDKFLSVVVSQAKQ